MTYSQTPKAHLVPKITADADGGPPIITMDFVDEDGKLLYNRKLSSDEFCKYQGISGIVDAFNERGQFELWKNRVEWEEVARDMWGPDRYDYWRGKPNPHAVKL